VSLSRHTHARELQFFSGMDIEPHTAPKIPPQFADYFSISVTLELEELSPVA
jgi:hypothetical protein